MKKAISLILTVCILFSFSVPAFAEGTEKKADPIILVHGMRGWGENAYGDISGPYWEYTDDESVPEYLRSLGFEVYVPSNGPYSSAWDRACETFAQLTGTVVDYGAAHSEKYGHERYGRDYTGKGFLSSDWYKTGRVNFVTHSFGGASIMLFTFLMTYGSDEEKRAAPNDYSPLFEGGFGKAIYTVTTLQSPHNGSPVADVLNDTFLPVLAISAVMNIASTKAEPATDYMLDQFGLTADPSLGKKASLNPAAVWNFAASGDNCAYDMSTAGAQKLREACPPSENTYYFSVSCSTYQCSSSGLVFPAKGTSFYGFLSPIVSLLSFFNTKNGTYKSRLLNDGLVPATSGSSPASQPSEKYDGNSVNGLRKGVWYVLPVIEGKSHGFGCTAGTSGNFWNIYAERLTELSE